MRRRILAFLQATVLTVTMSLLPAVIPAQAQVTVPYTVVPGDTLYLIAGRYNTSVRAIVYANNLGSDSIYPGQNLVIPVSLAAGASYNVQPGDTLYLVGRKYGLSSYQLAQENGITNGVIYPGRTLKIPAGGTSVPYVVQPGDTLAAVAGYFNTTAGRIAADNGLSPATALSPGQVLIVPTGPLSTYTVQPGDSLYTIATRYKTTVAFVTAVNNLVSNAIYPSQNIFVPAPSATGTVVYTAAEENLLARLITAEADGEPFAAQVGVGAVVLNRVKSPLFPDTITGVIYEIDPTTGAYQFTPVLNGWINNPASASGIAAARDALAGQDPTNGALYYFNTNVTNQWLQSLPVAIVIGDLKFSY
ncbi:MAG: LysM peptidoglycan-binding domain-containing protein [Peptococcaceae bacterium]|nr:LysM peptidoglycan-binding domain-containing protein [Peptococcaceae bacterium]